MIIKNNKELIKRIDDIISQNNVNMNVADLLNNAFSYTDIFNEDEINQYIKEGLNEKEAMTQIFCSFFDIDYELEENQVVIDTYIVNNIKKLSKEKYLDNPYVKAINKCGKFKKYSLRYIDYEPYQLFPYDDISLNNDIENSHIGYFDQKFSYLALCEGNNIWMSLNPNEIETMAPFINKAKGNVLVLGLGMGYVSFMMALKQEVKSVTIIEKDSEIIDLFNSLIWPNFKNKDKIKIVKDDAVNYVRNNKHFDYIFADLWHSSEDGLPLFVKLKRIDTCIDCWLEESMFALLRRCMITLLEENKEHFTDEDYKYAKSYTDKVINLYYQKNKNTVIETVDDLDKLLSKKNLLKLLLN